jgi:CheY-like chemotaxis protein
VNAKITPAFRLFFRFSRSRKMRLKEATVLIVDDEADLRDILGGWFTREGARVLVAENGAAALKVIEAN